MLLTGGRVVTPTTVVEPGWIAVEGLRIAEVGRGAPPDSAARERQRIELDGHWVLPGFVDLHCHGGGGFSFTGGDPDDARGAAHFHLHHGTTTLLLGLVTAPLDRLVDALHRLRHVVDADRRRDGSAGQIAGVLLEGPFLSEDACGAQNPWYMIDPSPPAVSTLLDAGAEAVRMMTIAPERAGALDAIQRLRDAGVIAAIGHTTADFATATAAIDAGATVATHLFNAMSPLHHREPATVGAVLTSDRITAELILDGHHVHDAAASLAFSMKQAERIMLITDAISAAGTREPTIDLGGQTVDIVNGAARVRGHGALAGSLLTMDRAVARAVAIGRPIVEVAHMAATTPARLLGLADTRGSIEAGKHADLVVLDEELGLAHVIAAGEWISGGG